MTPAAVSPHASGQATKIQRIAVCAVPFRAMPCRAVPSVQRALNFTFVTGLN